METNEVQTIASDAGNPDPSNHRLGSRIAALRAASRSLIGGCLVIGLFIGLLALVMPSWNEKHDLGIDLAGHPLPVQLVQPQTRNIIREIGQPSFVEPYERTSIFPKVSGYIEKWYVDIGDKVTKGQVLADLFVPEIEEDCVTKKATVELDKQRVVLAQKAVIVADADVRAAEARLQSAKAILDQYEAQVHRWNAEVIQLKKEVHREVVDPQVLAESENQLKASSAARDAAKAQIEKAEADLDSKSATLEEDKVAVAVAEANVEVAVSDWKRLEAWVGYLKLYAPFDGIVVTRNANTGDFVLPATGDPTANGRESRLSPSGKAAPIYVIDRTDVVRVFVDIPEEDANFVRVGTKATVLAKAFRDEPIVATVARTSWALNTTSRTLRAEIDLPNIGSKIPTDLPVGTREAISRVRLPNTKSQLLPGMYAYGKLIIERPKVKALPVSALTYENEDAYYWSYQNGKAVRTEILTGVSDSEWIEVTNRCFRPAATPLLANVSLPAKPEAHKGLVHFEDNAIWVPFDGSEQAIVGDLSDLTDGAAVEVTRRPVTPVDQASALPETLPAATAVSRDS